MPRMRTAQKTNLAGIVAAAALLALASHTASAGKFKVLHSFSANEDGYKPVAGLVSDPAGNLYGTASGGGPNGGGTIYQLKRQESGKYKFKVLYGLGGSAQPRAKLIVDVNGNLYGTTSNTNQVFELSPGFGRNGKKWQLKVLYQLVCNGQDCVDGKAPSGLTYAGASSGLPYDGSSPLYGTTVEGGANQAGVVFELAQNGGQWTETVLYNFCSEGKSKCTDGSTPQVGVVMDSPGNLFGTTIFGGGNNDGNTNFGAGVVYQLASSGDGSWVETVLHRFCSTQSCSDGAFPVGDLIMDGKGTLFGTTGGGGSICRRGKQYQFGCGVAFAIMPNGENSQETVLHTFCLEKDCRDGWEPQAGLVLDSSGNLFGTTEYGGGHDIDQNGLGGGTVFEIGNASFSVLHSFCSKLACADGDHPLAPLVMDSAGNLFGTTLLGGQSGGGTVFQLKP